MMYVIKKVSGKWINSTVLCVAQWSTSVASTGRVLRVRSKRSYRKDVPSRHHWIVSSWFILCLLVLRWLVNSIRGCRSRWNIDCWRRPIFRQQRCVGKCQYHKDSPLKEKIAQKWDLPCQMKANFYDIDIFMNHLYHRRTGERQW